MAWVLLVVLFGMALPLQPGINAEMRRHAGSPWLAGLISFAGGTLMLTLMVAWHRVPLPSWPTLLRAPWWAWTGGLIGAGIVTVSLVAAPRLGALLLVSAILSGQLIGSIIVDQFGLVGFPRTPVNPGRIAGVLLVLGGMLMIRVFTVRAS
jgi:transporter family-2 protein